MTFLLIAAAVMLGWVLAACAAAALFSALARLGTSRGAHAAAPAAHVPQQRVTSVSTRQVELQP